MFGKITPLFFLLFASLVGNFSFATDGYSVLVGGNRNIGEFSTCRAVTNGATRSIFVPTKTDPEWTSFYTNPPPGVTVNSCPNLTIVQSRLGLGSDTGGGTATQTITLTPTLSNSLLVIGYYADGASISSISDDKSNGWSNTGANASLYVYPLKSGIFYAANTAGGTTTLTINLSAATATATYWFYEISGASRSSPLKDSAKLDQSTRSVTATSPTLVTSGPSFVLAIVTSESAVDTVSAPFTLSPENGNGAAYYAAPSGASYAPVFTQNGSYYYSISIAAFQ